MYNEIEQLERNLTRKPAAIEPDPIDVDGELSAQPMAKSLLPIPEAARPKPGQAMIPDSSRSSEAVVGGRDSDFSGYDDLLKKLEGLKPRDTSNADLINMGVATGIGALFGRVGTGAKIAGEYGLDRASKQEKRSDSMEEMILKLQMDRAAKMAAGKKGTKVKSGGSSNWRAQIRLGEDGAQYWMTNVNPETGKYVPSHEDQRLTPLNAKMVTIPHEDGTSSTVPMGGNLMASRAEGYKPETKQITKDAEGNKTLVGKTTGNTTEIGQPGFNTTSRGLSEYDDKYYDGIEKEYTSKANPTGIANTEAQNALTAIADGNDAGAVVALKSVIRAMEQGKMSDKDFDVVKDNLGSSWSSKLDSWQGRVLDGQPLSSTQRKTLKDIAVTLKSNSEREHNRILSVYNDKLRKVLKPDEYSRLSLKSQLRGYDPQVQKKEADRVTSERNQYQFDNYVLKRDQQSGKIWKVLPEPGPDGKFKVIEEYIP